MTPRLAGRTIALLERIDAEVEILLEGLDGLCAAARRDGVILDDGDIPDSRRIEDAIGCARELAWDLRREAKS